MKSHHVKHGGDGGGTEWVPGDFTELTNQSSDNVTSNFPIHRSAWVVQSVERPSLGFDADHLTVVRMNPTLGSVLTVESA